MPGGGDFDFFFEKKNPVGKNVSTGDFEFFRSNLPGVGSEIAK